MDGDGEWAKECESMFAGMTEGRAGNKKSARVGKNK
jgi:hypothetical protein